MFGLNAKQLLILLLLVAALFAASRVAPIYFNAFQLDDFVKQEVKFAVSSRRTPEEIRDRIVEKAHEYNLALGPRDIHITRRGPAFSLQFDYDVPLDLRVYQRVLSFHVAETGELFQR